MFWHLDDLRTEWRGRTNDFLFSKRARLAGRALMLTSIDLFYPRATLVYLALAFAPRAPR